jgi:hypothetical protein
MRRETKRPLAIYVKSGLRFLLLLLCLSGCRNNADEEQAYQVLAESLDRSQARMHRDNAHNAKRLRRHVTRTGRRAEDVVVQKLAEDVLQLAGSADSILNGVALELKKITAGHPGNAGKVKQYLAGGSSSGTNPLLPVYKALRKFEDQLTAIRKVPPPHPALPDSYAGWDTLYTGSFTSFVNQFDHHTPEEAVMRVAQLKARVAFNASTGLEFSMAQVGPYEGFSRFVPIVIPKSSTVPVDSLYEADLLLGISRLSDWVLSEASINGNSTRIYPSAKSSFVASNGTREGNIQYWEGRFTLINPAGEDTILTVRRPYRVYDRVAPLPPQMPQP